MCWSRGLAISRWRSLPDCLSVCLSGLCVTCLDAQAERLLTHSASCTVPPRSLTIPAAPHARLVIRLRLWLGKQDALDKHLVHRCELLALHYACRRAPRPSQPPPELRSALSGMMPRLCPAPVTHSSAQPHRCPPLCTIRVRSCRLLPSGRRPLHGTQLLW